MVITIEDIDKIICDWSMEYGVAMNESAQQAIVLKLALALTPDLVASSMLNSNHGV